jgi:Tol biopolymer transport system component
MRLALGKWLIVALGGLAVLATLAAWYGPRLVYSRFGHLALEKVETGLTPQQEQAIRQGLEVQGGFSGRVIWSSSRSGNHELYLLHLPQARLERLTHNDYVDYFPRFSPDGRRVVFARSTEPWVSERDYDRWDAYLLDLETRQERRLARHANFPQWVDAGRVSFMRASQVVVLELKSGEERVIYDGEKSPVGGRIETPELCPGDPSLLALTARGKLRGVLVADLERGGQVVYGDGCEITWYPGCRRVLWVDNRGRGGSRMLDSPYPAKEPAVHMDLPGSHSHEYFPRLSRDGRWMVWGASEGDHEHDIADYEIFLWRLDQPAEAAVRLTYNPANDRWPDIHID